VDPISQGALGAALATSTQDRKKRLLTVAWLGALAGLAPDLDVLIRSNADPLLFLEYHRQFSHALVFVPFGALLVAWPLYFFARKSLSWRQTYLACLAGYATHGLLDACTSYGTQLFWPFSDTRVAWNNSSIVDPLFTLPVLALVIAAAILGKRFLDILAMAWALSYLGFGWVQQERALDIAERQAKLRGHVPLRLSVKPSFGNVVLFKSIYENQGIYHVDAVRVGLSSYWCEGTSIARYSKQTSYPELAGDSQQALDIERFRWFSDDYLAQDEAGRVIDMRYSMIPDSIDAMWGITVDVTRPHDHVGWWASRQLDAQQLAHFTDLLLGRGCTEVTK
jgi:inner membrane protein